MSKYVIGIDFGTLSGRAVVADVENGAVLASRERVYPHAVISDSLPGADTPLGPDWALQDPDDYLAVLKEAVPAAVTEAKIDPANIIGIGVDFTGCTLLPVKADLTPLCKLDEYRNRPNAWVKLWKHHAAQSQADRLNAVAEKRGESFLQWYGGKISSEWFVPKAMQILDEDPDIYHAADYLMEASEWIPALLTGKIHRNTCTAGYKCLWNQENGYPSEDFFRALHPEMGSFVKEKLPRDILSVGDLLGPLSADGAALLGLPEGIPVAVGIIDGHAAMPAVNAIHPGDMVVVMGTSLCHFILSEKKMPVEGICGCVYGGAIPGSYQYETGQPASGDTLNWFMDNCVPAAYQERAAAQGQSIFVYMAELAEQQSPGQSGLVALDWWNGNRSTLVDANLSGLLIGMTLSTQPEDIYRAIVESSAFGTRYIIDTCRDAGVEIKQLLACGGLSYKSPFWVQTFADVLQMPILVSPEEQTGALGASIYAAVAAGSEHGGYDSFEEACQHMCSQTKWIRYEPNASSARTYDRLYDIYQNLYQLFGKQNSLMREVKDIAKDAESAKEK